jgi:hypothetical protein
MRRPAVTTLSSCAALNDHRVDCRLCGQLAVNRRPHPPLVILPP